MSEKIASLNRKQNSTEMTSKEKEWQARYKQLESDSENRVNRLQSRVDQLLSEH